MPKIKETEFFYKAWTNTGGWGGSFNYSGFIMATSPKNALNKVWRKYGLSRDEDRSVEIYNGAAYRKMMPKFPPVLLEKFASGDGSSSSYCGNPDCPYC